MIFHLPKKNNNLSVLCFYPHNLLGWNTLQTFSVLSWKQYLGVLIWPGAVIRRSMKHLYVASILWLL